MKDTYSVSVWAWMESSLTFWVLSPLRAFLYQSALSLQKPIAIYKPLVYVIFIIISVHLRTVNTFQTRCKDLGLASFTVTTFWAASPETALGLFPLLCGQGMLCKILSTGKWPFNSLVPRKNLRYEVACTQHIQRQMQLAHSLVISLERLRHF